MLFAGEGETNLCLANWRDKRELCALLEEGCQVSRTGRVMGWCVLFLCDSICKFQ